MEYKFILDDSEIDAQITLLTSVILKSKNRTVIQQPY